MTIEINGIEYVLNEAAVYVCVECNTKQDITNREFTL
jgi:hypothetical protein